jgi:hypothetical protein
METENPYVNIIQQLRPKQGHNVTITTKHPKYPQITSYNGVLMYIRPDSCLIYDEKNKEGITIPYCVITEISK